MDAVRITAFFWICWENVALKVLDKLEFVCSRNVQLTTSSVAARDSFPSRGSPVCQKSRRIRHSNSPSADCQSKIGDMCGDFRAFPQEKLPYARERPGAERPVAECNTQKSGQSHFFELALGHWSLRSLPFPRVKKLFLRKSTKIAAHVADFRFTVCRRRITQAERTASWKTEPRRSLSLRGCFIFYGFTPR